jgi:phage head maturation protease
MREFLRTVEDVEAAGRVIEGTALTYDKAYRVSDDGKHFYLEGWRAGAFTDGIRARRNTFELRIDHADQRAGTVQFSETRRALGFVATADDTPLGDAVLALIDSGRIGGVSMRFESDRQTARNGVIWRQRGIPRELSVALAHTAQYDDALVSGRRTLLEADPADVAAAGERARRTADLLAGLRVVIDRGAALV